MRIRIPGVVAGCRLLAKCGNLAATLFINRRISIKVWIGFGCVLAILASIAGTAWFVVRSSADEFGTYARRVTVVDGVRDLDRAFVDLRRLIEGFSSWGQDAGDAVPAKQEAEALHDLLGKSLDGITDPDQRRQMEEISRTVDKYLTEFDELVAAVSEKNKLVNDGLDLLGPKQAAGLEALTDAATEAGDHNTQVLASEAARQFIMARLGSNKVLFRRDNEAVMNATRDQVEKSFKALQVLWQGLELAVKDTPYHDKFDEVRSGVTEYHKTFEAAADLNTRIASLVNDDMSNSSRDVQLVAEAIKARQAREQTAEADATLAAMSRAEKTIAWFAASAIILGGLITWLVGRAISMPVVRICAAMRALASGDTSVEIPSLGRRDEAGQMAGTVKVFKDNMLEAEQLRAEQEHLKAETETARKAGMLHLADTFEASIKDVVQVVSAQASQVQTAAEAMAATAQQTTHQVTEVASATEEANGNMQSVASSAEELSLSVLEINRQMEHSSRIACQAVSEVDRTNDVVDGLDKSALRIGEVVQLIQAIANQTNLLALNATIEAARAGDAGKGFAVVAGEVKSLASQTAMATNEIKAQINEVQSATGRTVKAIQTIGNIIREMNHIAATIASAVEQQGAATKEIAINVQRAAQGADDIAGNVGGVKQAAGSTGVAAHQLLGAAGELSKQANALRCEVDGFLTSVRAA